jgi:hypothetical protein
MRSFQVRSHLEVRFEPSAAHIARFVTAQVPLMMPS